MLCATYDLACDKALALSAQSGMSTFIYRVGRGYKVLAYQDIEQEYAFTIGRTRPGGLKVWQIVKKG